MGHPSGKLTCENNICEREALYIYILSHIMFIVFIDFRVTVFGGSRWFSDTVRRMEAPAPNQIHK